MKRARSRTTPALDFCEGARALPVRRVRGGHSAELLDWVADEVPVALEYNGVSHAVMLATPLDLADFALGFSLSEGILQGPQELYGVEEVPGPQGITLKLEIASGAFLRLKERRRSLAGRTGCGLCGTESLAHVARDLPELPASGGQVLRGEAIAHAMSQFCEQQTLQQATGAVHAAAWCSAEGELRWLREDVGRHNALDKLIGALARMGVKASEGFIAVTSRASFEMVQKTAMAGVPLLAAVSAPTSFAVATATQAGMTLVGFARGQDLVVYCHPERLDLDPRGAGATPH
ncbi:formate dehydrogenase accessory sulfurtransferase FdhD [Mitsuaria sp. WAJ17]|uniref:formate dehydrogenase accessory sulfurtransferase FdhD n=1 Tax=Mitsuaria sp. WAJ17 TaxID=2761452 RepID=UPI001601ED4D|nr:formate dehydrogenase accessory sulfurtransferase FdhD [Mitsuaria sp. WAJ17]MBB2487388.1 formate dehydrogenase accessory sulfurtransferase FdhD [Mitsuaria sp. WAJ17]